MRLFVAALGTETNTFSPIPTGLGSFEEYLWFEAGSHPEEPLFFTGPIVAARRRAAAAGLTVIEGLAAFAAPAGLTTRAAWHTLRDRLLDQLRRALPVEIVLLSLHGAMVADGCEDCEGDLLTRVRALVGPEVVVGAELDLHCHLSEAMVRASDLLVFYKEYPHTDTYERAEELVDLAVRTARREIRPVISVFDCRMIATIHTTREPAKGLVARMKALEGRDGVLSVSLGHGFPWADVADLGAKVLVITDGDRAGGEALAAEVGRALQALRGRTAAPMLDHETGIERALALPGQPIVLADTSDNAGGGAPSDATFLLRRLLERGIAVALGPFWDPVVVSFCQLAGVGARLRLRLGGKVGPISGEPLDLEAEVLHLAKSARQRFAGGWTQLGDIAAIRAGSIDVLVNTIRTQAFDPALFTDHGIRLDDKKLVVVKSAQHFHAGFAPVASEVLWLDGPGALTQDFARLPYCRVRRPIWPLDPLPA